VDSNDIEGIHFITDADNTLIFKANYPVYFPNPPVSLLGRPIGFLIEFGHTAVDE
jgi:hypothetical protein